MRVETRTTVVSDRGQWFRWARIAPPQAAEWLHTVLGNFKNSLLTASYAVAGNLPHYLNAFAWHFNRGTIHQQSRSL